MVPPVTCWTCVDRVATCARSCSFAAVIANVVEVIPAKYNTSSTLTADIRSEKQELNFDLEE